MTNLKYGLAVVLLVVAGQLWGAAEVQAMRNGTLGIQGETAFIQLFLAGWKQVLQSDQSTVMEKSSAQGDEWRFTGKLDPEKSRIGFDETVKKVSAHAWDAEYTLVPASPLYLIQASLTLGLARQKYSDAVIVIDGEAFRMPGKGEAANLPNFRKVRRVALGNEKGVFILSGDFAITLFAPDWGYQLRCHFTPGQGNISSARLKLRIETGEDALTDAEKALLKRNQSVVFQADETWRPVDTGDIQVKSGSALDLSALAGINGKPAGIHGRLIARPDGTVAFEKRPDTPVRFLGFNWIYGRGVFGSGTPQETAFRNIELFSDLVARQGYNMVRLHCLDSGLMAGSTDGDFQVPPQNWRNFDYLVKCFKERGIYLYVDLAIVGYYNGGWTPAGRKRLRDRLFFDEDGAREHWRTGALMVLNHVNSYSKLALKDDPVVGCVLFYNEQDLSTMPWQGYRNQANLVWQRGFHRFLKDKYGDIETVKKAWNDPAVNQLKSIDDIPFNGTERIPHGAMRNDMSLYYRDLQRDLHAFYTGVMKECGYKGLTTQYDCTKNLRGTALRTGVDVVSMHDYGAHPSNSIRPGSVIGVGSTISASLWYWRSINQTRLLDKPMMVTEYAQGFWNPYAHEAGIAFPAYSAFQGYSAIMVHADAVALEADNPLDEFEHYRSPVFRANEFLAAHLFLRGDVKPARGLAEVKIDEAEAFRDGNAEDALNSSQALLGLVSGFGVSWGGSGRNADLVMRPYRGGALIVSTDFTSTVRDGNAEDSGNEEALAALRRKEIVSPRNRTDFRAKQFESDTEELFMNTGKSLMTVTTGRTEAATFLAGQTVDLSQLTAMSSSVPALAAAISIDGMPLDRSRRIVLVYSTDAVNTGMEVSRNREMLFNQGKLPVLMERGRFEASLRNDAPLKLWALALDGSRTEPLPLAERDGVKHIAIDTGKLKHGPTVFFELAAD